MDDDNGRYMMGDKEVRVDKQSNIHVDGVEYTWIMGVGDVSKPKVY